MVLFFLGVGVFVRGFDVVRHRDAVAAGDEADVVELRGVAVFVERALELLRAGGDASADAAAVLYAGDGGFQRFAVHVALVGVFRRAFGGFVAFEQAEEIVVFYFVFVVIDAGAAAFAGRAAAAIHAAYARFAEIGKRHHGDAVGTAEAADVAVYAGKAALQYRFADGAAAVVDGGEVDVDVVRVAGGRPAERVNGVRLAVQLNGRAFFGFLGGQRAGY